MHKTWTVTIRATEELRARLDALVPRLAIDPRYAGLGRLSRATILRLALDRGLSMLAAELPPLPQDRPNG
jgi:hypothetical protein